MSDSVCKVFNFNIGILGHVDSGKTSLAKTLSTVASTAAFDKNPQSQERGITLDLGFSSFTLDMPASLVARNARFGDYEKLQFTLVDCPGHASLIRTVIGGAQIIDLVLLVIDAVKGVQTQTAECLLLGEVTCPGRMIVALNKIDLLPTGERAAQIDKLTKRLRKTLSTTSYADAPIVPVSATERFEMELLVNAIVNAVHFLDRRPDGKFLFAVDHCFSVRGQGTVMTGTVLSGSAKVGDQIEIPALKDTKKIKSIQVFRQPVNRVAQGERAGICVSQFDAKQFERGLLCQPGSVSNLHAAIVDVRSIPYFKHRLGNKAKLHISIGHETVMAKCQFFGCPSDRKCLCDEDRAATGQSGFHFDQEYAYAIDGFAAGVVSATNTDQQQSFRHWYALLEFEQPVLSPADCLFIASKLDTDIHSNVCRLAFHGRVLSGFAEKNYAERDLTRLIVYKQKQRQGVIDRLHDDYTLIVGGLFKKQTNVDAFVGLKVQLVDENEQDVPVHQQGVLDGSFGQSGKVKVRFVDPVNPIVADILKNRAANKKRAAGDQSRTAVDDNSQRRFRVILAFKSFVFNASKKIAQ